MTCLVVNKGHADVMRKQLLMIAGYETTACESR